MANAVATVLPTNQTGMAPGRFFSGEPFDGRTLVAGGRERQTHFRTAKRSAPHYLITPSLDTAQELITAPKKDPETPCRILAVLNQIFPLDHLPECVSNLSELITEAFQKWVASFVSPQVLAKLDLSLQFLSTNQLDYESYGEIPDCDMVIQFGISNFENGFFPMKETLDAYEAQHPGLAKHLLRMLSACPLSIGTPESIYEMASYFCWYGNETEEEVFDERYQEYIDSGESEDDARDMAHGTTLIEYAEFENYLPEWTFERSKRNVDSAGIIPAELQTLKHCYDRWERRKKSNFCVPECVFPGVLAPMDQKCYDFFCDVINRIGDDRMQCGGDYFFSTLAWPFAVTQPKQILSALLEIRFILEYFSACIDFLLAIEKEYKNA